MINVNLYAVPNLGSLTNKEADAGEDQDQTAVARVLSDFRPKDEGKQVRRRDQNQAKRRMVRTTHRDVSCGSSSTSSNLRPRRSIQKTKQLCVSPASSSA